MTRVFAATVGVLASVAFAAPAAAFTPPELFVRQQTWASHEPVGDWIPLASAPVLNYLGGYQVGYRLQDSEEPNEFQRVALAIAGVPDGAPTQPNGAEPFCVGRAGTVGTIVEAAPELQFEGNGRYTVTVSVGAGLDCQGAGASTTAAFSVDVHVTPALVGAPQSYRVTPLAGSPFVGVQAAAAPPGGVPDIRCALNGTLAADGSVTGPIVVPDANLSHDSVAERVFPQPGPWACVARGTVEGLDDNRDTAVFATPWSAPLGVDVRSDFRRRTGTVSNSRAKRPRLTFIAEWPGYAGGGTGTVTVSRVAGCKGGRFKLRKVATARGRFDAKRMRLTLARPRAGFYLGRFAFSGTRFLRAGDDPNAVLLVATKGRLGFSDPQAFPHCPGYRP